MIETTHELDEFWLRETALLDFSLSRDLMTLEIRLELGRMNFTERFRGDVNAIIGDEDSIPVTLRYESCLWMQVVNAFETPEALDEYRRSGPLAATHDIFDIGVIPPERSAALTEWQRALPGVPLQHFHLATLLNVIDIICRRITVIVSPAA